MASPLIQTWLRVDITFKHMKDLSTKTLSFTNRMPIAETSTVCFPLLKSISGCGLTVGQDGMPTQQTGTVTLEDGFDSIGLEKRVVDLLQEYTCNEQAVSIYDAQTELTDTSPASDFALRWSGKCGSYSHNGGQLSLHVKSLALPQTSATSDLDSTCLNAYDTAALTQDSGALGKTIPVAFGLNVPMPLIQMATPDTQAGVVPYAARQQCGGASYFPGFETITLWAKDSEGNYRNVANANWPVSYAGGVWATLSNRSEAVSAAYPTPIIGTSEYAFPLDAITSGTAYGYKAYSSYALTAVRVRFKQLGSIGFVGSPAGQIVATIYQRTDTSSGAIPDKAIVSCTVEKSVYWAAIRGTSDFWVYFVFPKPFVIENDGNYPLRPKYALGIKQSAFATSTTDFVWGDKGTGTVTGGGYWKKGFQASDAPKIADWAAFTSTDDTPIWQASALHFDIGYGNVLGDGKYPVPISFRQNGNSADTSLYCDLKLDAVAAMHGTRDTAAGGVTGTGGTASNAITYPHHAIKYLVGSYTGSAWVDSTDWDWTTFTSAYSSIFASGATYERRLCGVSNGKQTIEQMIASICKQTACRVAQRLSGKFALWPWGITGTVQKVFTDEDAEILSVARLDSSSVINRAELTGGNTYRNSATDQNALQDFVNGSSLKTTIGYRTDLMGNFLATNSNSLYGQRELENTSCNWLGRQADIDFLARYYLSVFDHPHTTVTLDAPYWENKTLELLDIVEILSAYLPASGGTSQQGREPTYNGRFNPIHKGHYVKRAQRYRTEIVGRQIDWQQGSFPKLSLECRIIKPYHANDPT